MFRTDEVCSWAVWGPKDVAEKLVYHVVLQIFLVSFGRVRNDGGKQLR
jgi:hypothetical protein